MQRLMQLMTNTCSQSHMSMTAMLLDVLQLSMTRVQTPNKQVSVLLQLALTCSTSSLTALSLTQIATLILSKKVKISLLSKAALTVRTVATTTTTTTTAAPARKRLPNRKLAAAKAERARELLAQQRAKAKAKPKAAQPLRRVERKNHAVAHFHSRYLSQRQSR